MEIVDIEVLEDLTARSRCDEGFLRLKRLRCRNRRADGSHSAEYRVDVVDRPRLDAVAVLVHRQGPSGLEVLTRRQLRPAAGFRAGKPMTVPDPASHLWVEETVAGLLELTDRGEAGIRERAVAEVREEAGFEVTPAEVRLLGAPFFVAPGILSEKIFPTAVDVTGREQLTPTTDGTPMEEGASMRFRPASEVLEDCRGGRMWDAKTELMVARLLAERAG